MLSCLQYSSINISKNIFRIIVHVRENGNYLFMVSVSLFVNLSFTLPPCLMAFIGSIRNHTASPLSNHLKSIQ